MIDDLDGENEAVQTVAFSLDSISYEIDLSDFDLKKSKQLPM